MVCAADCHTGRYSSLLCRACALSTFSVPEIKANPTRKNCLPSSRSKKVTGLSLKTGRATTAWIEDDDGTT